MRRRVLQLLTGVSLAIAGLAIAFWWRSYDAGDFVGRQSQSVAASDPWTASSGFWSGQGGMGFGFTESHYPPGTPITSLLLQGSGLRTGNLRWEKENSRGGSYYPFDHSRKAGFFDRMGFYRIRFQTVIPPPWKIDGSQLRAWRMNAVTMPYGCVVALAAILPIVQLSVMGRRWFTAERRRRSTLCPSCGYDLRASPVQCPECGRLRAIPSSDADI